MPSFVRARAPSRHEDVAGKLRDAILDGASRGHELPPEARPRGRFRREPTSIREAIKRLEGLSWSR